MKAAISRASRATLAGLAVHYLCFYMVGGPLWTDTIAQWIMARTPSHYALWLLENLGVWAKPFAMTGGLAALGFGVTLIALVRGVGSKVLLAVAVALMFGWWFDYQSIVGQLSFWLPATLTLTLLGRPRIEQTAAGVSRREAFVMLGGTLAIAAESFSREHRLAGAAMTPVDVAGFHPPAEVFGQGLVRKAVTPISEFYGMSKNTVDPQTNPATWRLKITVDGRIVRELSYQDLLALPRTDSYSTLRCVSNTLKSDLMGTAQWTGIRLRQLIDPASLPAGIVEVAIVGVDGHGDSLTPQFAFSDSTLLAIGMNGKSLDRVHGFPLRLVTPRYYGFKNVKWIGEIAFVRQPYVGTWPKLGYTKEPVVHTGSHIDRMVHSGAQLQLGGVSFAGDRGIQKVQVRAVGQAWVDAQMEEPLSAVTWRRWTAIVPAATAVEARAMDGTGAWQAETETPLFPNGVQGPTVRSAG